MYCGKCGTKNDDNAKFCVKCGEKIHSTEAPAASGKNHHRLIGIIAVILVAAIVLLAGIKLFGGRSAESTADELLAALVEWDLIKVHDLFPEPVQNMMMLQEGVSSDEYRQLLVERTEEVLQELSTANSLVEWGRGELKDVSPEALAELKEKYAGAVGIDISDAKALPLKVSINVMGFPYTQEDDVMLIKYKGSWYVDYDSIGNML